MTTSSFNSAFASRASMPRTLNLTDGPPPTPSFPPFRSEFARSTHDHSFPADSPALRHTPSAPAPHTAVPVATSASSVSSRSPTMYFSGTDGSQNQVDALRTHNKQLKAKLEQLERENKDLKRSVYQLSRLYNAALVHLDRSGGTNPSLVFDVHQLNQGGPNGVSLPSNFSQIVATNFANLPHMSPPIMTPLPPNSASGTPLPALSPIFDRAETKLSDIHHSAFASFAAPTASSSTPLTSNGNGLSNGNGNGTANPNGNPHPLTPPQRSVELPHHSEDSRPSTAGSNTSSPTTTPALPLTASSMLSVNSSLSFQCRASLNGHNGAVYCVSFAPDGALLASGSIDKTVRLWDIGKKDCTAVLSGHNLNVSDAVWSRAGSELLSGSFDGTARLWDVAQGSLISTFDVSGLVQCVRFDPTNPSLIFACSTSKKTICFDIRTQSPVRVFQNDSIVHSILPYGSIDQPLILCADQKGAMKTWSVSEGKLLSTVYNESTHKPISHITACRAGGGAGTPDGSFVAVNSYDNVIRVYDRSAGAFLQPSDASSPPPQPVFELTSHVNKGWPIRSSFFCGRRAHVRSPLASAANTPRSRLTGDDDTAGLLSHDSSSLLRSVNVSSDCWLLATGSADGRALVYDLSHPFAGGSAVLLTPTHHAAPSVQTGSGAMTARAMALEGHKDRVYATAFHPSEPVLATCSADMTVKLWAL